MDLAVYVLRVRSFIVVLIALAAAGCAARRAPEREAGSVPPSATWFAGQRMSGGEPIPAGALRRAMAGSAKGDGRIAAQPAAPGTWTAAGPSNNGGRLTAVAVDPNDANHVWAGAAAGGVFESHDAGGSWLPAFDGQPILTIGAVATHPASSAIVYVGTGEANGSSYSYDGDGVYKTTDGGATWQHLGLDDTRRIGRIAVDPVDPQRVFVAAAGAIFSPDGFRGIYRSTDGGATWSLVLFVATTAGAIDVAIDPSTPSRIYAAIWEHYSTPTAWVSGGLNSGIWQSLDGGDTWTHLTSGLPAPSATVGRIGLAVSPSSPQTVYALYLDASGDLMGLYQTTNAGVSWSKMNASGAKSAFGGAGYYCGQIRVDPADVNTVYMLDVYGTRSTDGGRSFSTFTSGAYVDLHGIAIAGGKIYLATDGGFYRSADAGATWFHSPSLAVTQIYDLGIDPVDPLRRFAGTQDMGTLRTTDGGSSDWANVLAGDGFQCEVDPIDHVRVYCEQQFGNIFRSTDGGDSFVWASHGLPPNERTNWSAPIVHDPRTSQRLYFGSCKVYRSTDGAGNWTPISPDLTDGPPPAPSLAASRIAIRNWHLVSLVTGTVTTIAVSAVDADVLWAGTDDGHVWVTQNGGTTWTKVDVPGRTEWVTRVEADPFSAGSGYVTYSGYRNASRLPRIFRTLDYGATWTDISAGLPDVPLNCVTADPDPAMRGRLFACSDVGVHVSDDYGKDWSALGTGMPASVVTDLDLIGSTRQLFAGTYGRSMYLYDLAQLGPADADGDGSDNLADCRPDDPTVFAAPGEVQGLTVGADRTTLSWISAAPASGSSTTHQVLRGLLAALPVGGPSDTCIVTGTLASSAVDPEVPPAAGGFWYLVRARNACGVGSYGTDSGGSPRAGTACP
jgi:photosystem II stability/assembly factor-like uncharacterized protein